MAFDSQLIDVRPNQFRKLLATDATSTSFTAPTERTSRPADAGVMDLQGSDSASRDRIPSAVMVVPYGAGSDNATLELRIYGFRPVGTTWTPYLLAQVTCTLCATTGVSGGTVGTGNRYVDTVTLATGYNANVGVEVVSPANDTPAHIVVVTKGSPVLLFDFDMTGATSANCLVAEL